MVTASVLAWSPDGAKIAYAGHAPGTESSDIFVMNADGTGPMRMTTDPRADWWPVWSPDGTRILLSRQGSGGGEGPYTSIVVMNADGSDERTLVQGADLGGLIFHPAWQPVPSAQ